RPLVRRAGDDGVEAAADLRLDDKRRRRLAGLAFDLVRVVLLARALQGERFKLVDRIRRRVTCENGFHESLRDEIREPPVRRRRVRIVADGQTEMAGRLHTWRIDD